MLKIIKCGALSFICKIVLAMTDWIFNWKKQKNPKVSNYDLFCNLDSLCGQCQVRPRFVSLGVFFY